MTIIEAMQRRSLFRRWFEADSWNTWRVFLKALFAVPLSESELPIYTRHTQRQTAPTTPCRESWVIAGRRGGKSRVAALVAVYLACFRDYRRLLAAGEMATVAVIAADRRQARTVLRYVKAFIEETPALREMVRHEMKESIELKNRCAIEIHTCSFRSTRGYTLAAVVADEVAFWRDENSANPDSEILTGLRPGMATVSGSLLLCISSPYARRGVLWQAYKDHYGKDGDAPLVWQGDTRSMNPLIDQRVIDAAYAEDEASASAEYGALFRKDIEVYVSREALDAVVIPGRRELPPVPGIRYSAFVDPSGGSQDSMTLAIAHAESQDAADAPRDYVVVGGLRQQIAPSDDAPRRSTSRRVVLDCVRERKPPFSPADVVAEFAGVLKTYNITSVTGDRYGGEWVREPLRSAGIAYVLSEKPKSDLYRDLLPLITSQRVELLDDRRMLSQLASLERRTSRSGRDSIDHVPNAHDDLCNSVAGAVVLASERSRYPLRPIPMIGY